MAKYTKEEYALIKRQKSDLLNLILKKTGTSRRSIIDLAEQEFVWANLDMVTPAEKKRFNMLVFSK
jgi:hypothetical protein